MAERQVKPGIQFRFTVGDANVLWEVKRELRKGVWACVGVNEPILDRGMRFDSDYAGQTKEFLEEDIRKALSFDAVWEEIGKKHEDFYKSLKVDQIVHYEHTTNSYVRCVVVLDQDKQKVLKPIALVGQWRQYDVSQRLRTGEVHYGYNVRMILSGETMTPNSSTIYESPDFHRKGSVYPGGDPPLSFEPPPFTKEQENEAILWKVIEDCRKVLEEGRTQPFEIVVKMIGFLKEGVDRYMEAKRSG